MPISALLSTTFSGSAMLSLADAIAKATRLKDATAIITGKSGKEARIMFENRSLAFANLPPGLTTIARLYGVAELLPTASPAHH